MASKSPKYLQKYLWMEVMEGHSWWDTKDITNWHWQWHLQDKTIHQLEEETNLVSGKSMWWSNEKVFILIMIYFYFNSDSRWQTNLAEEWFERPNWILHCFFWDILCVVLVFLCHFKNYAQRTTTKESQMKGDSIDLIHFSI